MSEINCGKKKFFLLNLNETYIYTIHKLIIDAFQRIYFLIKTVNVLFSLVLKY